MMKYLLKLTLVMLILYNTSCGFNPKQTCLLYNNKDSLIRTYSMIIIDYDTLYCNRFIEGRKAPKFNKKISGRYLEVRNNGSIRYMSYVYKGNLQGLYLLFDYKGKKIEEGFFKDGCRYITNNYDK